MTMNKTIKILSLAVAMFAIVGMTGVFINSQVFADKAPDGFKKEYQFIIIARPNPYNGNCGEGDRLFVEAGAKGLRHAHINIQEGGEWNVSDCNATGNKRGEITFDGTGTFLVFAIARGTPGTSIDICLQVQSVHDLEGADGTIEFGDHLCLIDVVKIKRDAGKGSFSADLRGLFLDDHVWSVDVNGNAKIHFIVYKLIPV